MAPPNTEDQFKFLIACIKHSTAGKVGKVHEQGTLHGADLSPYQIDFSQVATECEIVTKGAASVHSTVFSVAFVLTNVNSAKRYERLMKAHGIAGNGGGGRASSPAPSGPSTPTTPVPGKVLAKAAGKNRAPANKKRKLAARGDDIDENIKTEVKTEIKNEAAQNSDPSHSDGSYNANPTDVPLEMATFVKSNGEAPSGGADDEVFLVSEVPREYGPPTPLAFMQQMLLPPPPESFYGFVDHFAGDMPISSHSAMNPTSAPMSNEHDTHEHNADYTSQAMRSEQVAGHWLQHQNPAFF